MADRTPDGPDDRAARIVDAQNVFPGQPDGESAFNAPSLDDARERLRNATVDPFLGGCGWSLSAAPGGVVLGRVSVEFPRPEMVPVPSNVYVHVWVGSGNVDPTLGTFLLNVDDRFPRLTQPRVPGLQPGTSQVPELPVFPDRSLLAFELAVPPDVEPSVYLGNICLMRRAPFGVGDVLGRASFAFRVRRAEEPPDLAT